MDDLTTLAQISRAGEQLAAASPAAPSERIAIAGGVTLDYLRRAIACAVSAEGVFPVLHQAPFGALVQQVLDSGSALHAFAPDLVVIAPSCRDLVLELPVDVPADVVDTLQAPTIALYRTMWTRLGAAGIRIIQHTLVPPAPRYRGLAERLAPAAPANQVRRLNERLIVAGAGIVHFVDLERIAGEIGARRWSAARFHYTAKLNFDPRWLPDYLAPFRAAWRAAHARTRKLLALDLDNTLWGGVIGDDGVDGIALGPGSASGEAFADWQHYLKGLSERGVVLAVCSKNAPEIAVGGFSHPGAVLRREDFASFACSWSDKPAALRRMAQELNLGLDSFVFADDNPAECALVQQALPEVAVVHLGTDPAQFIERFDAGCWFDLPAYTGDDLGRATAYAARAAALAEKPEATDIDTYLAGLAMRGRLYRPGEPDIVRMAQLEQKTNQFNLTTRRYSEAELRALLALDDAIVLALRLSDRFGDHGLVATLIALQEGDTVRIASWLMSCRVFARTAEALIMRRLIEEARERGAMRLVGEYAPTVKNGVVADLYPRLGFVATDAGLFCRRTDADIDDLVTHIAAE
ncbi:MAG: HAD-IIIC family phosphatase [Acetobacteraceae bacterium]